MNLIKVYVLNDGTIFDIDNAFVPAYGQSHIAVRLITQFTGETAWYAKFKKPNKIKTIDLYMGDSIGTEQVEVSPGVYETWKQFQRTVTGTVFDIESAVTQNVKGGFDYWFVSSDSLGVVYEAVELFAVFTSPSVAEYARVANTGTDWVYEGTVNATEIVSGNACKIVTAGTTDYTLIGAPNNNIGTIFISTGVATGTGTAEVWEDSTAQMSETVQKQPTQLYAISVDPNFEAVATEALNNEEVIIDGLNNRYTKTESDDRYVQQDLEVYPEETTVEGTDMLFLRKAIGDSKFVKVAEFVTDIGDTFTQIKLLDGSDEAIITYKHTNGNNFQVVQIEYPDGRVEEINEVHEYNYRNGEAVTFNSGNVLMTNGTTLGNQAVTGLLYDEDSEFSENLVGVVTVDNIAPNAKSKATYLGIVTGIQESDLFVSGTAYDEGQIIYARDGKLSNVAPSKPSRIVRMGAIINKVGTVYDVVVAPLIYQYLSESNDVDDTGKARQEGLIYDPDSQLYENTLIPPHDIISATVRNTFDLLYDSAVSNMRLTMKSGATFAYLHWSDRVEKLDVTDFRFTPNFGSDTAPTANYMYLTKGATAVDPAVANTNSSYPAEEHIPIGELSFFSEVTTNAENKPGPVRNQNINNHHINEDKQGGYTIVTEYLRDLGVLYLSGMDGAGNLGTGTNQYIQDDSGTYYIKVSSGLARQYNKQIVSATDTTPAGGDDMHVHNDATTPYRRITNLNQITDDATGTPIATNQYFNVVLNRIVNKTGEYCTLFVGLPLGTYTDQTDAINDISRYTVKDVPTDFNKVYQPLVIITLKKVATGAGLSHVLTTDIRKDKTTGGGGGGGVNDTSFFDNQFEIKNNADPTKLIEFDASQISTATKRTLTAQDKDYVLADKADVDANASAIADLQTANPSPQTYTNLIQSTFGTINPIEIGSPLFNELLGLTLNQITPNGDVATSVTGVDGSEIGTNTDGTLVVSNFGYNGTERTYNFINGNKYFYRIVLSGGGLKDGNALRIRYETSAFQPQILTQEGNVYYSLITANATELANVNPLQDGTTQIDRVNQMLIPIDNTPYSGLTASQINDRVSYFEGLTDLTNFSLQGIGKNLFNEYQDLSHTTYDGSGNPGAPSNLVVSTDNLISGIQGSTTYTLSRQTTGNVTVQFVFEHDENDNFIKVTSVGITASGVQFTTDANTRKIRIQWNNSVDTEPEDIRGFNVQLEEGTSATTYAEYKTNTQTINGTFRSVGSVRDKVRFDTDRYVVDRYVGYDFNDVVQSATSWIISGALTNTHLFRKSFTGLLDIFAPVGTEIANAFVRIGNVDFKTVSDVYGSTNDEENLVYITSGDTVRFRVNKTTYPTSGDFEAYLQANDVTFYYEYDTPLLANEEIDSDGQLVQDDPTTLIVQGNLASEFELIFSLNNTKQIGTNAQNNAKIEREVKLLEDRTAVVRKSLLDSTVAISNTTLGSANVTLNETVENYDEVKLVFKNDSLSRLYSSNVIKTDNALLIRPESTFTKTTTLKQTVGFEFEQVTTTTFKAHECIIETTNYGSPANVNAVASANYELVDVIGYKYN